MNLLALQPKVYPTIPVGLEAAFLLFLNRLSQPCISYPGPAQPPHKVVIAAVRDAKEAVHGGYCLFVSVAMYEIISSFTVDDRSFPLSIKTPPFVVLLILQTGASCYCSILLGLFTASAQDKGVLFCLWLLHGKLGSGKHGAWN